MNHRFLVSKEIERLFDTTSMSVSEIFRTITQERFTGLKIENRSKFDEISDEGWLTILEKAVDFIDDEAVEEKEFETITERLFKDEQ